MKKSFFQLLLILPVLLLPKKSAAQDGFNISVGVEFPELINLGLRVQFEQSQLGFSVGSFPDREQDIFSLSGAYYYHWGGHSEFTDLQPWFLKAGLTYLSVEDEWSKDSYFLFVPRGGYQFNVSPKFAVALEAGIVLILSHDTSEDNSWFNFGGSVWPSGGLRFIYILN